MLTTYTKFTETLMENRYAKNNNFEQIRAVNAKDKSLLKHIGPNIWSLVPHTIKETPTLKTFINSYRTHLIDTVHMTDQ